MKAQTNITRIVFLLCSFFFFLNTSAQAPNAMSYQAVIRNASNVLVSNANVGVRISILQTTATGTVVFSEYHTPTTNANGLATLQIGAGTILIGNFATINWANGPFFIKTETDPTGGTNYTISGTSQLLSVPFALYAASSGSSVSNWTATGTNIANNNSGSVGIGTGATVPSSLLTVKEDGIGFTQEDNVGTNKIGFYTDNTSAYLQTHSNTDLSFSTNNGVAKMTLQKVTGNLGIGITAPTEKLEVNGKTKTTNLQVTTGAAIGKVLTSDATGNATWQIAGAGSGWSTTGNSGTNPTTNFIGTTDNNDIVFKRNNTLAGRINDENVSLGDRALNAITSGIGNVAMGRIALFSNTTASYNTGIGASSLFSNITGQANTVVGYNALSSNTSGGSNTAIGTEALKSNATAYYNVAVGDGALYNSTASALVGIGYQSLYSNTTGNLNTAIGYKSMNSNTTGIQNTATGSDSLKFNTIGYSNTANGSSALRNNTIGYFNTAFGSYALSENNVGFENTAIGTNALTNNIDGFENTAIGNGSLSGNQNGDNNTAVGFEALKLSTSNANTAIGGKALWKTTTGSLNVSIGASSLQNNTYGFENVAIGTNSLSNIIGGSNNTAIGTSSGLNIVYGNNNVIIGNSAVPPTNGDNQVRIGNTDITYAGIQVAWSITSDKRWKSNIQKSSLGLDFIKKLNPVSYFRNNDESKKVEYGFIAQEVEESLNSSNASNNGIITKDDAGMYSVRYNDLLSPMVKAIQELEFENQTLKSQNQELEKRLKAIEDKLIK